MVVVEHRSEWGTVCGSGVSALTGMLICKEVGIPHVSRVEQGGSREWENLALVCVLHRHSGISDDVLAPRLGRRWWC